MCFPICFGNKNRISLVEQPQAVLPMQETSSKVEKAIPKITINDISVPRRRQYAPQHSLISDVLSFLPCTEMGNAAVGLKINRNDTILALKSQMHPTTTLYQIVLLAKLLRKNFFEWTPEEFDFSAVTDLDLSHYPATGIKKILLHFKSLRKINLTGCSFLSDDDLKAVADFPKLESLSLRDCPQITDAGLKHLSFLYELKQLDLSHFALSPTNKNLKVTDLGLRYLRCCTKLERLDLSNCNITDVSLKELSKFIRLKYLNLTGCDQISDQSMSSISDFAQLRTLHLTGCNISDHSIPYLADHPELVNIGLSKGKGITEKGISTLGWSSLRKRAPLYIYISTI